MNGYTELDRKQQNTLNRGATVVWKNVNVYTKDKKTSGANLKRIINNSTGFIQPGTLMAVMGSRLDNYLINCYIHFVEKTYRKYSLCIIVELVKVL